MKNVELYAKVRYAVIEGAKQAGGCTAVLG